MVSPGSQLVWIEKSVMTEYGEKNHEDETLHFLQPDPVLESCTHAIVTNLPLITL